MVTSRDRRTVARRAFAAAALFAAAVSLAATAAAHPLGNFTINHYSKITLDRGAVTVRYVVDMAEISAFQAMQAADANQDGTTDDAEKRAFLGAAASDLARGLDLRVDGAPIALALEDSEMTEPAGAGGLTTLRLALTYSRSATADATTARRLSFVDANHPDRIGWREIVVAAAPGTTIFDSSAFGSGVTDELAAYPADSLASPLAERSAELSFTTGAVPADAKPLLARDGAKAVAAPDRFAMLIGVRELTPGVALLGLLVAAGLGGLHAMSPGHGKTVVGAYLVGSRGTAKHAAFLGLTVTITHTAGVFALGLVTLFASKYVVPETLFPILSFVSGAIVVIIGLGMFRKRLASAVGLADHDHEHGGEGEHEHDGSGYHTHGGRAHSHVPPGADAGAITWRNLLALGISGGILPCPSALVVLLSAIALHRVGYGLLLIVAFSLGLAGVLTGVGLAFVYAKRFMRAPASSSAAGRVVALLPALSALVITCAGLAICYESLAASSAAAGVLAALRDALRSAEDPSFVGIGAAGILGLGLLFGLKHATEADHVVAVSTIVSEHKSLLRSALVGAMWGTGHTASLVAVGAVVLALRISISELVSGWLEFGVAVMIVVLGANALVRALRRRADVHLHTHAHAGERAAHAHVHFHEGASEHGVGHSHFGRALGEHTHAIRKIGVKPLVVGAIHGLAGSATLTLLVLTQIDSPLLGLLYLAVFGIGSIGGMLIMSGLVGLPFVLGASRLGRMHAALQIAAGAFSITFGLWYAYHTFVGSIMSAQL